MMKKWLLILMLISTAYFASAPVAPAQEIAVTGSLTNSSADCSIGAACATLDLPNATGSVSVLVTGTFSATLQFEASVNGTTWVSISGDPLPSGAAVSSSTATGTWVFNVGGLDQFRIRASAYTSGTASVTIRASPSLAKRNQFGSASVAVLNNIRYADQFAGADAGAKITAAYADLPSTGGTVDARGLEGAQTCSSQVNITTNNITILLGAVTLTNTSTAGAGLSACFRFASVTGCSLRGLGREATKLVASATGAQKDSLVSLVSTTDCAVTGMTLDANGNATDGLLLDLDSGTWLDDLYVRHDTVLQAPVTRNYGIRVRDSQNLSWGSIEVQGGQLDGVFFLANTRSVTGLRGGTLYAHDAVLNGVDITGTAAGSVSKNDFGYIRADDNGIRNAGSDDEFGVNVHDNVIDNFLKVEVSGNRMHGVRLKSNTNGPVSRNVFWINAQGNGVGTGGGNALTIVGTAGNPAVENKVYGTLREGGVAGNHALSTDANSNRNYIQADIGSSTTSIAGTGNILFGPTSATNQVFNGTLSISSMTTGSIPFFAANGVLSQDNASLFWDAANFRVGVRTATPGASLDVANPDLWHGAVVRGSGGTDVVVMGNLTNIATIGAHNSALGAWANLSINQGGGNVGIGDATPSEAQLTVSSDINAALYETRTNCADSAGAAACGAAPAGAVVIDAAATTVVVSTTAVTANSRIFIQEAPYLATELAITCNTTTGRLYTVTALTAATSFTITASAAPITNPACLNYWVVN